MKARLFTDENRKWWTLVAVSFGLFMIMLDNTVVNVALPSIRDDLGISVSELEWVVNAYALTFGVLLLSGGKLADLLGRRRDLHRRPGHLHRRLALVRARRRRRVADRRPHRPGRRRRADEPGDTLDHHRHLPAAAARNGDRHLGRRLGARPRDRPRSSAACSPRRSAGAGSSSSTSRSVSSRVLAARAFIDETKDTSREQRLDLPGLITSAVGLFALTYGLIETNTHAVGLAARRSGCSRSPRSRSRPSCVLEPRQRLPMLDLSLFRNPTFSGANTVMGLVGARDVRHLLLQLALPAERPRLQRDQDRRDVPADDAADHPGRPGRREVHRPDRAALADGRRDDPAHRLAAPFRDARRSSRRSGTSCPGCSSAASGWRSRWRPPPPPR